MMSEMQRTDVKKQSRKGRTVSRPLETSGTGQAEPYRSHHLSMVVVSDERLSGRVVNLTKEGDVDWLFLGLGGMTNPVRRSGGSDIEISLIGDCGLQETLQDGLPVEWTNGNPVRVSSGLKFVWALAGERPGGIQFRFPAERDPRLVQIRFGGIRSAISVSASLTGSGVWKEKIFLVWGNVEPVYEVALFTYRASGPGQSLTVELEHDGSGMLLVQSVALAAPEWLEIFDPNEAGR